MDKAKASRMTRDEAEALLSEYANTLRANPLDMSAFAQARAAVLDAMMGGAQWRPPETANGIGWVAYMEERDRVSHVSIGWRRWDGTWRIGELQCQHEQVIAFIPLDAPEPPEERVKP